MAQLSGVYFGKVVDVMDPGQQRRVKVQIAAVSAMGGMWAPACVAPGSTAGSTFYRPGDDVVVAFEGGSAEHPVVLGRTG